MTYIIAVSGGVDSVVLLDMMSRTSKRRCVVAHFDHGIREDSSEDAAFVESLAAQYDLEFVSAKENLGPDASEALARERRYAFLNRVGQEYAAQVITAHHLDDLVETVAINLTRGTGWRGLAVFDSNIARPLVDTPKAQLLEYARQNGLTWREDSTNASDVYLRNRIRKDTSNVPHHHKRELRALQATQRSLKKEIEAEVQALIGAGPEYDRYFMTHIPAKVAEECLRVITKGKLTRPQLSRALLAIKTAAAGSEYEAGSGVCFHFSTRHFSL